jgi:hypothetical protein
LNKSLVGRKITCNMCERKTVAGASRVMRKVLFFFCPGCWFDRRSCEIFMDRVSARR